MQEFILNREHFVSSTEKIANHLIKRTFADNQVSLLGGKTGVALSLLYYDQLQHDGTSKYGDAGMELLVSSFSFVQQQSIGYSFSGGLAGIGWGNQPPYAGWHFRFRRFRPS